MSKNLKFTRQRHVPARGGGLGRGGVIGGGPAHVPVQTPGIESGRAPSDASRLQVLRDHIKTTGRVPSAAQLGLPHRDIGLEAAALFGGVVPQALNAPGGSAPPGSPAFANGFPGAPNMTGDTNGVSFPSSGMMRGGNGRG